MLQERSLPERSCHLILANSYFFPSQISRLTDAAIAVHVYVAMAKSARWEEWNCDVAIVTAGNKIGVSRKGHLGDIKISLLHNPPKQIQRFSERDDPERDAYGLYRSIQKRGQPVEIINPATRDSEVVHSRRASYGLGSESGTINVNKNCGCRDLGSFLYSWKVLFIDISIGV